jgi:integrase
MAARRSPGEGSIAEYTVGKARFYRYRAGVVALSDGTRVQYPGRGKFTTKKAARDALSEARQAAKAGELPDPSKTTVSQQLAAFLAKSEDEKTRNTYQAVIEGWLVPFIGDILLTKLTVDRVLALVDELKDHGARPTAKNPGGRLGASSVRLAMVVLGAALQMAVRRRVLTVNVARDEEVRDKVADIKKKEARKRAEQKRRWWWTQQELNRFLAWASENDIDSYLVWRVYAFTGIRNFEGLALQWRDVQNGKLDLRVTKYGKLRERPIPLDGVTARLLEKYRDERRALHSSLADDEAFIFADENGRPPTRGAVLQRFYRAQARCRADLGESSLPVVLKIHGLRHTYVSLMLKAGKTIVEVSELIGDTVEVTSKTYKHFIPDDDGNNPADDLARLVEGNPAGNAMGVP